jgi:hypothetical protein
MSAERTSRGRRTTPRGGLPPDDDLSIFAKAVGDADDPAPAARPLAAVPRQASGDTADAVPPALAHPAAASGPEPVSGGPPDAEPAAAVPAGHPADEDLPAVPHGDLIRQATISVGATIAERFRQYQKSEGSEGPAPSNAEVIFRALDACAGRYPEIVAERMPQAAPGRRFGAPVPGRRASTEARLASQINYRPTYAEAAEIRRLQAESGARSVSAFLDAVLDAFLPPLKRRRR